MKILKYGSSSGWWPCIVQSIIGISVTVIHSTMYHSDNDANDDIVYMSLFAAGDRLLNYRHVAQHIFLTGLYRAYS